METAIKSTIYFNEFSLDPTRRILEKNGEPIFLNPKALDLLLALVEKCGEIVGKNELLDRVWVDQFVEENNLTVHVAALRKALGEKKGEHRYIVTVPGNGYSFVAKIRKGGVEKNLARTVLELSDNGRINSRLDVAEYFSISEPLIGRTSELSEIKHILRGEDCRLLTLTGAGGSGKTSLARAVAGELSADFTDGIFFVELASLTNPELVVSAIGNALGLQETGEKSLFEMLCEFLQERRILLILDNFEQILTAAPHLQRLINATAFLKILVTSRAALRLKIEIENRVAPLALPPRRAVLNNTDLTEYASVALFLRKAQSSRLGFSLTKDNAYFISEICRKLDGLPLAIELAAVRVKLLSPQAILERLENSLKLLTGGAKDLPARQRTMRDAIKWSYDLLEPDEQILFRRLSVFAGGFTIEAAEFLAEYDEKKSVNLQPVSTPVLDLLSSLIDNSLLVSKEQKDGNARLQMLEVVREFAFEVLRETNETENVRKIHAEFFLALAEEAEPLLHGETGKHWHEKLETEHDNLRAALSWSLKYATDTAARIAAAARFFWLNRNYIDEGMHWINAALAASGNIFSQTRGSLLLASGLFRKKRGNFPEARKCYEEVLEKSVEAESLTLQIKANHGLAAVAVVQKDFESAQKYSENALTICREIKDERQLAFSLCALGDLEMCKRNLTVARPLFEECLEISRNLADDRLLMVTLYNLGMTNYFEKEYERAADNFIESLRISYGMKNTILISCSLDGIAAIYAVRCKPEQAAFLNGAVDSLNDSIGYNPEPADEIFRRDYIEKTRLSLGVNLFNAVYEQGKNLKSEEVITYIAARRLSGDFQNTNEVSYSDDGTIEIVIEKHKFEKFIVDEVIED